PELGEGGRVRRPARVADLEVPPSQGHRLDHVDRRRVHHHGRVRVREDAALEELDLAAAALLGGGADDAHREADVIGDARGGDARADGDGGDQVVPAGVADAGEAVVLGAQGQVELPLLPGDLQHAHL